MRFAIQFGNPARRRHLGVLVAVGFVLVSGGLARAVEQVELTNGFSMRCDHHALVDGAIRLYMDAGSGNFMELAPSEVRGFERLPAQRSEQPAPENDSVRSAQTATKATARAAAQNRLDREQLQPILDSAGREHDLDVDLLASIVQAESANHPRAVSRAGAEGLMQLMPTTAQTLGVANAFAPEENVHGGAAYLDGLLARYHENLSLALAAYNAGPAAVDRWHGIPPYRETRLYVARVIHLFNQRVTERRRRESLAASHAALGNGQ